MDAWCGMIIIPRLDVYAQNAAQRKRCEKARMSRRDGVAAEIEQGGVRLGMRLRLTQTRSCPASPHGSGGGRSGPSSLATANHDIARVGSTFLPSAAVLVRLEGANLPRRSSASLSLLRTSSWRFCLHSLAFTCISPFHASTTSTMLPLAPTMSRTL